MASPPVEPIAPAAEPPVGATLQEPTCQCAAQPARPAAAPGGIPIACDLSVFTPAERREHILEYEKVVLGQARRISDLEDGYAYHYANDPGLFLELSRWVGGEIRCCPFLQFGFEIDPTDGTLVLKIQGKGEAKTLLTAELEARGALARVSSSGERTLLPVGPSPSGRAP